MFTTQNPNPNARRTFILFRPFVAVWQWLFPPTVAHRDRQSTTARILGGLVIVGFCMGLIAFGFLNGKKWYDTYQTWQANRLIKKAESLEKQDRLLEAWIAANDAYKEDPENPNVLRTLARFYVARKQREALYLLDKLERVTTLTDEDRILRIQALANNDDVKAAYTQIVEVLKKAPPSPKMVEIADRVMLHVGKKEELLALMRDFVQRQPDDRELRLMQATRQVQYAEGTEASEGLATLWKLAEDPTKLGLDALRFLDERPSKDDLDRRRLIPLLAKHPLAEEEDRISALRLQTQLEPSQKVEIVEKAIADHQNAKREDLVPLARWLTLDGEHERLLSFLKPEMVQEYPPLLGQYLNALTLAGRMAELEQLVKDPRTRLTTAERAFYRAHLAFVMKKKWEEVNDLLRDALEAARNSARPEIIITIGQWSEQREHPAIAEQAFQMASKMGGSERLARMGHEGLLRLTYMNGNSKGYLEAAQDTARRWPDNATFIEQSLYASLLAGIEIESSLPRARKLLDAKPDDTQRKLIMALAQYRMLDRKAALDQVNHIDLSELRSMGKGAVLCGIMYGAGGPAANQATAIARQIPADATMLPEERKFLQLVRPDVGAPAGTPSTTSLSN